MQLDGLKDKAATGAKNAATGAKKLAIRGLVVGLLLVVVGIPLYTFTTLKLTYSEGERTGFVQKLSHKGWVCKTNEGELSMVNLPGQPAEKFLFTVPDDAVAKQIDALAGHKVSISYKEHAGIPSTCFGETPYFVSAVRKVD